MKKLLILICLSFSTISAGKLPKELFNLKKTNSDQFMNSFAEFGSPEPLRFPCPASADISPCVCNYEIVDGTGRLYLDCTHVTSEHQLDNVFQQNFPVKNFYEFRMNSSSALTVLDTDCNGVNFERIYLDPGPFTIQHITDHFYSACSNHLTDVRVCNSQLTSVPFPPFPLNNAVDYFSVYDSKVAEIPTVVSSNIYLFTVADSNVTDITPGKYHIVHSRNIF